MSADASAGVARATPRHAALGLLALLAVLSAGFVFFSKSLYSDVDGRLALAQIAAAPAGVPLLSQSQIFPLQGMGTQRLPGSTRLNPGYAILGAGRTLAAVVGSYLFFAAALALSVYSLGRALGLGLPVAVLAAQAACLLPFPPLEEVAGYGTQLRLNPGVAYPIAIALVLLALLLRVGAAPRGRAVAMAAAIPALFAYSLLCDPIWTVVPGLSLAVFFVAALLVERTRGALARRGGALLFGAAALAALSVPSYLRILFGYTARSQLRGEIMGEVQNSFYTFMPFQNPRAAAVFALLLLGTLLALSAPQRRVRIFATAVAAHMALMTLMSAVYLYTDVNWTFPVPAYFQQAALPVYLLVAAAGWREGWARLRGRLPRSLAPAARLLCLPAFAVCLLPAVGAAALAVKIVSENARPGRLDEDVAARSELSHPYVRQLQEALAPGPGQPFRGSVALRVTKSAGPVVPLLQSVLWLKGVPTLEEYSQLVSPQFYYLLSRGLGKPDDGPAGRNRVRVTVPRVKLLRALGVRFVLGAADAAGQFRELELFELTNPNLGGFSPVRQVLAMSARETVDILVSPGTDLERDVVLTEPVAGPLVKARSATMRFVEGGVRVSAVSDGRSLLLLPLQYSHALRLQSGRGAARLVRANLAQTGLVFDREIDVFISLEFGLGRVEGRARDLVDVTALGIREDGSRAIDPASMRLLHPSLKLRLFGP